jgi:D-glucosaminate-6-phosphate ammonia-lyase
MSTHYSTADALFEDLELRRVINASGTLTTYGQSAALPQAIEASSVMLPEFVELDVLHARASQIIAELTGSEAGFVTACAAAGLTLSVAACMTGTNPARIFQLPDTMGMKDEVILQLGHAVNYGAPVEQGIRLAGANVKFVGTVNGTSRSLLDASFSEKTAAAMFVESHHTVQYGYVPLPTFVEVAHSHGVPVIVDAAAEESLLPEMIAAGADLVVCSGHKHFRAPTSGVMAGRLDLIQAAHAQNRGIGRGMKIGKEGIVGLIVAMKAWSEMDHEARQEAEKSRVQRMVDRLAVIPGITAEALWPEPDVYPISRAKISVDPATAGLSAMALSVSLAQGNPTIKTRGHHVEEGYFLLDPFNLTDPETDVICARIEAILAQSPGQKAKTMDELAGLSVADLWAQQGTWPNL